MTYPDIVERLQYMMADNQHAAKDLDAMAEAAAIILADRKRIGELEEALRRIANARAKPTEHYKGGFDYVQAIARATMKGLSDEG